MTCKCKRFVQSRPWKTHAELPGIYTISWYIKVPVCMSKGFLVY